MRRFSQGLLLLSAALGATLTSCSDDAPWSGSDTEGGINLNLTTDSRVIRQSRADDAVSPVVPDGNLFAVSLTKSDGSYAKEWTSVEAFNREKGFPIGDYTLKAFYGSPEQEGFELPYYSGTCDVHVAPGADTDASVTARLANAMVSIRYTDAFKENFTAFSAAVQTEGHDWVIFAQNETRPAYIAPSEVKLNLTLTNDNGDRVTVQPAGFTAQAQRHYVVTVGVTGSITSGNLALDVQFDEDVTNETVHVPLGDELWTAPAPTVTAKGFTVGTAIESFEQATLSTSPEFNVFAYGGLRQTTLTLVTTGSYTPTFGRSVDLVGCDALTQTQLKTAGVDCSGFFKNVDKMGVVNVKKFIEQLPAGEYKIELQAVDALTRTSDPLELDVKITAVELELAAPVKAEFMATELTVDVLTNCPDVKDNISFKAPDESNRMVDATVKSVTAVTSAPTRADLGYRYRYVLEVSPISGSTVDVQAILGTKTRSVSVPVNIADFALAADGFARFVKIKVAAESDLAKIVDNLKFYNGDSQIAAGNISRNSSTGIITISGLTPGVKYLALRAVLGSISKTVPEFTTEEAHDVDNGDFSSTAVTVNINPINAGGVYRYCSVNHTNRSSILASEPLGWASINAKTAYTGASTQNTWFVVPSTLASNGEVLLRSVAYDHAGTMPSVDNHGVKILNKFSRNAPSSFAYRSAGELFLGSYSFDGTEHRVDGIAFESRPSSLTFQYKYTPVNNESAEALIYVLDSNGNTLAGESVALEAKSAYTPATITLTYKDSDFGKKAAKIQVCFRSTKGSSVTTVTPSGSSLEDVNTTVPNDYQTIATNEYKSLSVGSQLWLDNVKLNYDGGTQKSAPRKVSKRRK